MFKVVLVQRQAANGECLDSIDLPYAVKVTSAFQLITTFDTRLTK